MTEFHKGIIVGFVIYTTLVSLVALLTNDDDNTLAFAIGFGWIGYFIALLFAKYVRFSSDKLRQIRMNKKYK